MNTQKNGIIRYAMSLLSDHFLAIMAAVLIRNFFMFFSEEGFPLLTQIICFVILYLVFYVDSWKRGCSDGSRIRLGRMKKNYFRGFLAGLIAAVPGLLLATGAFLAETGTMTFLEVFDECDVFTALNRVWNMPLASFLKYANEMPALNFVFPLFMPIVSGIGYVFGMHEIALKQFFLYKNSDDEDDEDDE